MHLLKARENKFDVFFLTFENNVNIFSNSENFGSLSVNFVNKCDRGIVLAWSISLEVYGLSSTRPDFEVSSANSLIIIIII